MASKAATVTILHYNDVYNVEPQKHEPIGGATRFCSALKSYAALDPLVLFSGDAFSPSLMSTFTKGEQMVPVLNSVGTHCAVYGNHDFDFGMQILQKWVIQTEFPWLMSNVVDKETGNQLADGLRYKIFRRKGKKIGVIGLVEIEWLETLSTIEPDEVDFTDYVTCGRELAKLLKDEHGCDYVIALTHMRFHNDVKLAENVDEIDLILGGHDHVYDYKKINGTYVVKSGTDFREFSVVTLNFEQKDVDVKIEKVEVTSEIKEDEGLKEELEKFYGVVQGKLGEVLGTFGTELDGRFSSVRTQETNLGNFICDVMLAATHSDIALLNSGTLRSDRVHEAGPFTLRDLMTILPIMDPLVVIGVTGTQLLIALENSVSKYPALEGRFPQIGGMRFAFDPQKPSGSRIDPLFIRIGDEYWKPDVIYNVVTKCYLFSGRDGYDILKEAKVVVDEEECPELITAIQNHFQTVSLLRRQGRRRSRHHQNLVSLSRMHSIHIAELSPSAKPALTSRSASVDFDTNYTSSTRRSILRRESVDDIELKVCHLEPTVDGRIVILTPEVHEKLMSERRQWEFRHTSIISESTESND